jgi:GNAT superfamily N-acetyltransferase
VTEGDLALRGLRTAVACWEAYAATIPGGAVHRLPGVDVAVFTEGPERDVFNNAVLAPGLDRRARASAVEAMAEAYASAGIASYAAWVLERDTAMRDELERRGVTLQETTWAMGRVLEDLPDVPTADVHPGDWADYLRLLELPEGLLTRAEPSRFDVLVAHLDGRGAATAMAFDHDRDCGVFNVATLAPARRRGLASALVAALLHRARERGCTTATLQSTPMARAVYAGQGFADLGRILELGPRVPPSSSGRARSGGG